MEAIFAAGRYSDSNARHDVVPTATMDLPSLLAAIKASTVARVTEKRSACMSCSSIEPVTGRNVPAPTCNVTRAVSKF